MSFYTIYIYIYSSLPTQQANLENKVTFFFSFYFLYVSHVEIYNMIYNKKDRAEAKRE
jgi:hypothetical protein